MKPAGKLLIALVLVLVGVFAVAEIACRRSQTRFDRQIRDLRSATEKELPSGSSEDQAIGFLNRRGIFNSVAEAEGDSVLEKALGAPIVVYGGIKTHTAWCYNFACSGRYDSDKIQI